MNAGVSLYAVACAVVAWRAPALSLSSAALVILNAAGFHLGSSILVGAYSPGTMTALVLFIPSGLLAYIGAARDGMLTRRVVILSVALGLLWHVFLGGVFYVKYFAPLY